MSLMFFKREKKTRKLKNPIKNYIESWVPARSQIYVVTGTRCDILLQRLSPRYRANDAQF